MADCALLGSGSARPRFEIKSDDDGLEKFERDIAEALKLIHEIVVLLDTTFRSIISCTNIEQIKSIADVAQQSLGVLTSFSPIRRQSSRLAKTNAKNIISQQASGLASSPSDEDDEDWSMDTDESPSTSSNSCSDNGFRPSVEPTHPPPIEGSLAKTFLSRDRESLINSLPSNDAQDHERPYRPGRLPLKSLLIFVFLFLFELGESRTIASKDRESLMHYLPCHCPGWTR